MTITDLKELSPFLAVIASILALTLGPFIAGRASRVQAIVSIREKWIYAFRDCLVELITEFDVLHECMPAKGGLLADQNYEENARKIWTLANRVRLMINPAEPLYVDLLGAIERSVDLLRMGIEDYSEFHALNSKVKALAQDAIRNEWKKIAL